MSSSDPARSIHVWNRCHACGQFPITGYRFSCQTCPAGSGNDLCEACHRLFEQGRVKHPAPEAREAPPGAHVFRRYGGVARERVQPWLAVQRARAEPPIIPDGFVVRPEFRSGRESFFGSYGFILAAGDSGSALLLTALHVLDELAKCRGIDCSAENNTYTGEELPRQVTSVQLYDPFASNWMLAEVGTAGPMLRLREARMAAEEPYSQSDIAAFRVTSGPSFRPAPLAQSAPRAGEPVWIAASRRSGTDARSVEAVVVESTPEALVFRYAPQSVIPPHGSGAPVINGAGEVVGINSGGGMFEGQNLGHGCHADSIRRHLGW